MLLERELMRDAAGHAEAQNAGAIIKTSMKLFLYGKEDYKILVY